MMNIVRQLILIVGVVLVLLLYSFSNVTFDIPVVWNLADLERSHVPPPDSTAKIRFAPESYYYSLPTHTITKTFPVYVRETERAGYIDSLRKLAPENLFDVSTLKTEQDWIAAGKLVFNWPVAYSPVRDPVASITLKDFEGVENKLTKNGRYLFSEYVLIDGQLMSGQLSCASCHTRLLPDGTVVDGAQGNLFNNMRFASAIRSGRVPFAAMKEATKRLYFAPWAPADLKVEAQSADEFADRIARTSHGVSDRQGGTYEQPLKVPSLIGVKQLKYLDATGLMINNGPEDLMRYAALNQGMDMLTSYDGFIPGGAKDYSELPETGKWNHPFGYAAKRYSDEQLYALVQYLYSLKPPTNPNHAPRKQLERGEFLFKREGCVTCHTPPLYTNNKLTPAGGFEPTPAQMKRYSVFNVSVGTDSVGALYSRRGTGYYKVPSLRNIWMNDAFFHNGEVRSLEEVFDPKRLTDKSKHTQGHAFGLELNESDKKALIEFLKSL